MYIYRQTKTLKDTHKHVQCTTNKTKGKFEEDSARLCVHTHNKALMHACKHTHMHTHTNARGHLHTSAGARTYTNKRSYKRTHIQTNQNKH